MIFTTDLQQDKPSNVYNNNIVEFKATDEIKTVVNSTVEIGGSIYELTPNLLNVFRFNFIKAVKALTNQNNFKDNILFDLAIESMYPDVTLYHELDVTFKILFSDTTDETTVKTYKFIKSVEQIIRKQAVIDNRLFPLITNSDKANYLTYFEGYPFDIALFSDVDREITILNKRTQNLTNVNLLKGVNRWCVSDGQTNITLENILPLYLGVNELEFKIGAEIIFTIFLTKKDADCGTYVKWFNQSGSYSFWLLPLNKETQLKARTIDDLESDFENLDNTQGNFSITGKEAGADIKTVTQLLTKEERSYVSELLLSPRVEMLGVDRYSEVTLKDWISVKAIDGILTDKSKYNLQRLPINIQLPNLYTQTL